jgi:D-3-phosphoglycerate dehydrogenase
MSNKPTIYVLDAFHPIGIELARQHADVICWPDPRIKEWPEKADGVMVRMTPITAEQISRAQHVKIICKQGVGLDTIDLEAAKSHGIPISRTPGVNSEAVAELALALALSVTRRVTRFDRMIHSGDKIVRPEHLGLEMSGKVVGVIGMGNIGTCIAKKWIGAFGCKILAHDPYAPMNNWADIAHERIDKLNQLLPKVDLLTLHLPLTPESHHLLSHDELSMMKNQAVLINVSRGGLIDENALFDLMSKGHLYGVGLDVFEEQEPPSSNHPLLTLPNVVTTPHAGGGTIETQIRSSTQVAQQVIDVLMGKPPVHTAF